MHEHDARPSIEGKYASPFNGISRMDVHALRSERLITDQKNPVTGTISAPRSEALVEMKKTWGKLS